MIFKRFKKLMSSGQGFTMIELLIVISVLGILAVAVLSAINPLEQINRGRDTGGRSDSEQLLGAIDRYYTQKGRYPWQATAADLTDAKPWKKVSLAGVESDNAPLILTTLSETGTEEIRTSFVTRLNDADYQPNPLYIYKAEGSANTTYVCFKPKSASFISEGVERCGTAGAGLPTDLQAIGDTVCGGADCGGTNKACVCLP